MIKLAITIPFAWVAALLVSTTQGFVNRDDEIADILAEYDGVGLTAWSVDGEGNMCSLGSSGERIVDSGEAFRTTGDSRHYLASNTKSMTATLLAILIEDGTIPGGWETKMKEVLPVAEGSSYEDVTLREWVGMLSGLTRNPPRPASTYWPDIDPSDVRALRRATTEAAMKTEPIYTPGTTLLYSNWAYIVAGHIVEELLDTTWEEALAKRLFLPLGIDLGDATEDYVGAPDNDMDPWGHSYDEPGNPHQPCDPSYRLCGEELYWGPAATFSGPVAAMARYLSWHIQCHNGAVPEDDPAASLLSQESCQQIHTPADPDVASYGYGWNIAYRSWAGGDSGLTVTHVGGNRFMKHIVWVAFGANRAYAGFTNGKLGYDGSNSLDGLMVDAAIWSTINGEQQCDARIPSSVYVDSPPTTTVPPPTATATPPPTDLIRIKSSNYEGCIELRYGVAVDDNKLILGDCADPDQTWRYDLDGLLHTAIDDSKCMQAARGGTIQDGSKLRVYPCDKNRDEQVFVFENGSNQPLYLANRPELCVVFRGVYADVTKDPIILKDCEVVGRKRVEWDKVEV